MSNENVEPEENITTDPSEPKPQRCFKCEAREMHSHGWNEKIAPPTGGSKR